MTTTISNYHREMYEKYKEVQDYVLSHLPDDVYTDLGDSRFVAGVEFFAAASQTVFGDIIAEQNQQKRRKQYELLKAEFEGDTK